MKRTFFRNASNYDNPIFSRLAKFFGLIILNFIWVAASLAVFTVGAASTAMYYTVVKNIRHERASMAACFTGSFKENFLESSALTVILMLVFGFLFVDFYCYPVFGEGSIWGYIYLLLVISMWTIALLALPYVFPLLSRFRLGVKDCLKHAITLSLKHLHYSMIQTAVILLSGYLILIFPYLLFVLPALVCYLNSLLLEKVFRALLPKNGNDKQETLPEWYEE